MAKNTQPVLKRCRTLGVSPAAMGYSKQSNRNPGVKIVKLMTFGAFAEIIPGVDGLIHISQIADRRIGKPEDVLSEGQEVDAKIIDIDQEHKRISLSIRALLAPAGEDEE